MKKICFFFLFINLSVVFGQYTLKVNMVKGNAQYFNQKNPDLGWQKVQLDMKLNENYKIRTSKNSRLELTDGNNIFKLSSRSTLSLSSLNKDFNKVSLTLLTGKLHSIINKLLNKNEIDIITPSAILAVRGTDFVTITDNSITKVFVFKGVVELSDRQHLFPPVSVKENQLSEIQKRYAPSEPKKIPFSIYQEFGMPPPLRKTTTLKKENLYTPTEEAPIAPTLNQASTEKPTIHKTTAPQQPQPVPQKQPPQIQKDTPQQKSTQKQNSYHKPKKNHKPLKPHFALNANIGPANINNTNFQQITLMPDFGIGKFGIGLYIPIYMNLAIGPFPITSWHNYSDWDFRNWDDGFSDAINKFLYVRYGTKNEPPVFIKAGNINNFVIGYGFLMNQFSNMVHFPEIKQFGLQFDITTKYGGFESMTADVMRFQIIGGRIFITPFFWTQSTILQKINFGYSHIVDTKPTATENNPALHFYGFDLGMQVVNNGIAQLSFYLNFGKAYLSYKNGEPVSYSGSGFVPGLKGKILFILYKLEYRNLSNNFPIEYFDINYENTRYSKFDAIKSGFGAKVFSDSKGILGELGFAFGQYGHFSTTFWDNLNSPHDNKLHSELVVAKGLLPKIYGTASFDKYNIINFKDLYDNFFDYRTILQVEGIYSADPKIDLAFIWKRTYIFNADTNHYQENTSISIETRFSFF